MNTKQRALEILLRLKKAYPNRGPFVEWKNPLELVVGTVLSAQCTDVRVNQVVKILFKKYKTAEDYANADTLELQKEIYSTGFYKSKTKYLKGIGKLLVEKHNGEVPQTLEELLLFPGVSYKTANLVLAKAFGKIEGVSVDTHVNRVSPRLGFTKEKKTTRAKAKDLEKVFPKEEYLNVNELFIMHGRAICSPGKKPKCESCILQDICPSKKKFYPFE